MSELDEKRWSVMSERGCEASGLDHTSASGLMRRLKDEKVYGLCVITDEAARRLAPGSASRDDEPQTAEVGPPAKGAL